MAIKCCKGCVPPKKNGYCHTYCVEYIQEKAEHDRQRTIELQKRNTEAGLDAQTMARVNKICKAKRKSKGRNYG